MKDENLDKIDLSFNVIFRATVFRTSVRGTFCIGESGQFKLSLIHYSGPNFHLSFFMNLDIVLPLERSSEGFWRVEIYFHWEQGVSDLISDTLFATKAFNALGCVLIQLRVIESDQKCISFNVIGITDITPLYNFAKSRAADNSNFRIVSLKFKGPTLDFEHNKREIQSWFLFVDRR